MSAALLNSATLALLHRKGMHDLRPWSEAEFDSFLAHDACFVCGDDKGFALGRVIAGEAELLTIVTDPDHRKKGLGRANLLAFHRQAQTLGAEMGFLEVMAENTAAITLYLAEGWEKAGVRKAYYHLQDGRKADALVMTRTFAL